MADRIVFRYPSMESSVGNINKYADEYQAAAETFLQAMNTSTESWEGDSKEKFMSLVSDSVYKYMHDSVPEMVRGLASLLKSNAEAMQETDKEIASKIPPSI